VARAFEGERLVIASHNAGKVHEIGVLLAPYGVSVISAGDLGLPEPAETEETFAGNARIKAHAAARAADLPALSDDSGLCVPGLGGAPGVHTADWAETPDGRDFGLAMARLWRECEAARLAQPRAAFFSCTLCLAWPDGHDEIFVVHNGIIENHQRLRRELMPYKLKQRHCAKRKKGNKPRGIKTCKNSTNSRLKASCTWL